MVINKIKSENQSTDNAIGVLGFSSTPSANQSLQQTGVVVACFLKVQRAAAKLKRYAAFFGAPLYSGSNEY